MDIMGVVGEYFALVLFMLTVASGLIYLVDKLCFEKKRKAEVMAATPDFDELSKKQKQEKLKAPLVADYARSLFPVFFAVLIIRSFIGEPFKIPSGSMLPGFKIGDYLVVNKFSFGLKVPVWGSLLTPVSKPKRGDVVIFHYPVDTKIDFIKRVIGLPGDHISYFNKKLTVNGQPIPTKFEDHTIVVADSPNRAVSVYQETNGKKTYKVINMPWVNTWNIHNIEVPKDMYFVMGDNRDNSEDSRFWGFVPAKNLVGKPEMVIMSWGPQGFLPSRIGHMVS